MVRDRLDELKTALADSAARSDIECGTLRDEAGWHDLSSTEGDDQPFVEVAVEYLNLRGLLEIHPELQGMVRFRESE